jgi:hypothetical protein
LDFLDSLLPESDKMVELIIKNNEQLGETDSNLRAVYDLYCENEKGEKFIVEQQIK